MTIETIFWQYETDPRMRAAARTLSQAGYDLVRVDGSVRWASRADEPYTLTIEEIEEAAREYSAHRREAEEEMRREGSIFVAER